MTNEHHEIFEDRFNRLEDKIDKLSEDFNSLFRNGPISNLSLRVGALEQKEKAVRISLGVIAVPVVGWTAVKVLELIFR